LPALPEHPAISSPLVAPNPPVLDVTASFPIDNDPAPANSGSGLPLAIAVLDTHATQRDVPAVQTASIKFAVPLVAVPVEIVAAYLLLQLSLIPSPSLNVDILLGLLLPYALLKLSHWQSRGSLVYLLASPKVFRPVSCALFVAPIGSAHGAIRPQVHGPLFNDGRTHANLLEPEYGPIEPSGLLTAPTLSAGGFSGPHGMLSNRVTGLAPGNANALDGWTVPPSTRPNPAWIFGGLTSASPGSAFPDRCAITN
jgi:hypothetical protein